MTESIEMGLGSLVVSSIVFSPIVGYGAYIARRNRQLIINGSVVQGYVTEHKEITIGAGTRRSPKQQVWSFCLQFTRPDKSISYGRVIQRKTDDIPDNWKKGSTCKLLLHPTSHNIIWCIISATELCKVELDQHART